MIGRTAAGAAAAACIALVAWRARSLSSSGAITAVIIGTLCVAAGWDWGALLIAFFVPSTALSRMRAAAKERRTRSIVAKGGTRDATQVLANGGIFAAAAALSLVSSSPQWVALGAGALAAATADTWATEIGTLAARAPRLITTWREVIPGTSGGVTVQGLVASLAGASFIAATSAAVGWPAHVPRGALVGGMAGSLADSLLGARLQARRRCPACDAPTEREVHDCGTPTRADGGLAWLDNDAVNFASGIVGAVVALLASR